jgi:energy-coupling factor transport system substrate-specific component
MDDTGIREIEKLVLHDGSVFDIKIIGDEIWFIRSRSVSVCNIQNLLSDDALEIRNLQRRDGLTSTVTANSWNALSASGTLYIGTTTGVFSISTRDFQQDEVVPFVRVSGVFDDGVQVFEADGIFTISRGVRRVDIHASLLSFTSRDGTLSYMLEGFDEHITTVGRNEAAVISYTNLSGGSYTFRLFGTNADGVESEVVVFTINKEYTLVETPFIRLLAALIIAGAVLLGVRGFVAQRTKTLVRQRQEYKETAGQIMSVAALMADSKNKYIDGHSHRGAAYSKKVGARLGMTKDELETLYFAALLHDIGTIGIPDSILNKNGPLTDEEYAIVKNHVTIGADWLKDIVVMGNIAAGVKHHNERIDGKGYPGMLSGGDIPLMAKIICICNAFDSMMSDRSYRKALPMEKIQSEFISNAGIQFDERITAVLISLITEGEIPLCE